MRLQLTGPFRVFDDEGQDVTPKGIKERGLLALLVMSPGQRRTRAWLQDKLWSERTAVQASGSSRQALSNMRRALGPLGDRVHSNRSAVWISPPMPVDGAIDPALGEVLDDIDIADPEFSDWLRNLRMQHVMPENGCAVSPALMGIKAQRPVVLIRRIDWSGTGQGGFCLQLLSQKIGAGVCLLGNLDVIEAQGNDGLHNDANQAATVELECLDGSENVFVLLRVKAGMNGRIEWSGRLTLRAQIDDVWITQDVFRAVNNVVQAVCDLVTSSAELSPYVSVSRAIRRIYDFNRGALGKAEQLLTGAIDGEFRGPAQAWLSFVQQTKVAEYRESDAGLVDKAMDFVQFIPKTAPHNAVVWAIASETTLRMTNDLDLAHYLAGRAMALCDDNPYALSALCQTNLFQGRHAQANQLAERAQTRASGLFNSFDFDLDACFAKLNIGDLEGAYQEVLKSHYKAPFARHSLRYLTALSWLLDKWDDAARFGAKLSRLEADFVHDKLLCTSYPMGRLREAGLIETLRTKLGQSASSQPVLR